MAKEKRIVDEYEYDTIMSEFEKKAGLCDKEKILKDEKLEKKIGEGVFIVDYNKATFEEQKETVLEMFNDALYEGGGTENMFGAVAILQLAENLGLINSTEFQVGIKKIQYVSKHFPQIEIEM